MEKRNILYYTWGENTYEDCVQALRQLGHNVFLLWAKRTVYDHDVVFMEEIGKQIKENAIDAVFTFDYFPDLSRVAMDRNVEYFSWCYDSPHLTLESVTLANPCNRVFLFDFAQFDRLAAQGIETVYYMPMACDVNRVQKRVAECAKGYEHDITFLGNMYDDEYNFYDQIKGLSPYAKGYIDAAMEAQSQIYGMDMVRRLMRDDLCREICNTAGIDMGPDYRECGKEVLLSMIQKKITVTERRNLLTVLGEYYKVDHYANKKSENLPVNYCGYADYRNEMPVVFATSKINLNITLRSIQTGIPLRVIDILGAGGFCLTNYQAELTQYFENGKSIAWFESYEDLFEKVNYYLGHDAERVAIARAGHEIVAEEFTYEKLLTKILSRKSM